MVKESSHGLLQFRNVVTCIAEYRNLVRWLNNVHVLSGAQIDIPSVLDAHATEPQYRTCPCGLMPMLLNSSKYHVVPFHSLQPQLTSYKDTPHDTTWSSSVTLINPP